MSKQILNIFFQKVDSLKSGEFSPSQATGKNTKSLLSRKNKDFVLLPVPVLPGWVKILLLNQLEEPSKLLKSTF